MLINTYAIKFQNKLRWQKRIRISLKLKSDPRSIWKIFKELGAKRKTNSSESNINIKQGEQMITNETDLAELFNDYFVNVASNLKEPVTLSDNELLNNFVQSQVPTTTKFNIPLTTLTFVQNFYRI